MSLTHPIWESDSHLSTYVPTHRLPSGECTVCMYVPTYLLDAYLLLPTYCTPYWTMGYEYGDGMSPALWYVRGRATYTGTQNTDTLRTRAAYVEGCLRTTASLEEGEGGVRKSSLSQAESLL